MVENLSINTHSSLKSTQDKLALFYFVDISFQDTSDEEPAGEDARSIQAHQEILKSAASQKSMQSEESIGLSMEATKATQNKLLKKSVHDLIAEFPIYRIDSMVSIYTRTVASIISLHSSLILKFCCFKRGYIYH